MGGVCGGGSSKKTKQNKKQNNSNNIEQGNVNTVNNVNSNNINNNVQNRNSVVFGNRQSKNKINLLKYHCRKCNFRRRDQQFYRGEQKS